MRLRHVVLQGSHRRRLGEFGRPISSIVPTVERRHQPLTHIAVQVQDQIADTVAGLIGAPPHLLFSQGFDAGAQARPVLLHQLPARELQKETTYIWFCRGHRRDPLAVQHSCKRSCVLARREIIAIQRMGVYHAMAGDRNGKT